MYKINYLDFGINGCGLTNQIYFLITGIIIAYYEKKNIIIVKNFLDDYNNKYKKTAISHIFDLQKINSFLTKTYNLSLVDVDNLNFKLNYIKCGDNDIIKSNCVKFSSNKLYITNKNNMKLDIQYNINNITINEVHYNDVMFDISKCDFEVTKGMPHTIDQIMFDNILLNIHYNSIFLEIMNKFYKNININNKINVIHLRLENDAIVHWHKHNNMDKSTFLVNLENKYIDIIKHYINKTDLTIVLTSSLENNVINFLKNQKYNYKLTNKLFTGREKNAIIDLLVATKCNNIFLSVEASTFSCYISKLITNNVKQLSFNLCNISEDIKIINTCNSTLLIYDKNKIEQNLHNFYIRAKNRRKKLYLRYLLNYYFLPLIFILLNITVIYLLI